MGSPVESGRRDETDHTTRSNSTATAGSTLILVAMAAPSANAASGR